MYIKTLLEYGEYKTAPSPKSVGVTYEGNCNLKCRHCYWTDYKRETRPVKDWSSQIEQLITWDADIVYAGRILSNQGASFIENYCSKANKKIGIIDNGFTILDFPDILQFYSYANISVDGAREDHDRQRSRHGAAAIAWDTIKKLLSLNVDVVISSCISPLNTKRWMDFEREVRHHGVPLSVTPVVPTRLNRKRMPLFSKEGIIETFSNLLMGCNKLIKLHDLSHIKALLPMLKEFKWSIEDDCIFTDYNGIHITWMPLSVYSLYEVNLSWDGKFYTNQDAGDALWIPLSPDRMLTVANSYAKQEKKLLQEILG